MNVRVRISCAKIAVIPAWIHHEPELLISFLQRFDHLHRALIMGVVIKITVNEQ